MKITLLKNHLGNVAGSDIEVTDERGNYLIRTKVGVKPGEAKQTYINKPNIKNKKRNPKS